jgi:phosphoglycolate phosphatase-like HAD superfamily hydrolase
MNGFPRHLSPTMTVFCDFDGPIVDVSDRYYGTYYKALIDTDRFYTDRGIALPLNILSKEQFWQMKQERVPDRVIAQRSGLEGGEIDRFLGLVEKIVNSPASLQQDSIQRGVNWALNLLVSQNVQLVLVTLRHQDQVTQILEDHNLSRLFAGVYGTTDDCAAYRNYADIKTQLLDRAMREHLPRSGYTSAWMVGDTEADIIAGKAMNIPTIALTCGIRSYQQLSKLEPTLIMDDLFCAAHYLAKINTPAICV